MNYQNKYLKYKIKYLELCKKPKLSNSSKYFNNQSSKKLINQFNKKLIKLP